MKKGFMMTLALLLVVIGACFVSKTYARYAEKVEKNGTAAIAKWAFASDNDATTFNIDLAENYDAATLVEGKIAPGTRGSFDIVLSNKNTETAVDVLVKMTAAKVPTNLKFYTDSSYTSELTETDGVRTMTDVMTPNQESLTKKIYWKWEYQSETNATEYDSADTANGKETDENRNMTVRLEISGTQKAPTPVA